MTAAETNASRDTASKASDAARGPDVAADPPPQSFLPQAGDAGGVRALKLAIIGMGMLIAVGLFAIAAKMIAISQSKPSPSSNAEPALTLNTAPAAGGGTLTTAATTAAAVPVGAEITHTALDGKRLAVTYTQNADQYVVIIDVKTGEIWRRLRLTPASP